MLKHQGNQEVRKVQVAAMWGGKNLLWGGYKCSVDVLFSIFHKKVGINICISDENGRFLLVKMECFIKNLRLGHRLIDTNYSISSIIKKKEEIV